MNLRRLAAAALATGYILCLAAPSATAAFSPWADREEARYTAERLTLQQREEQALQAKEKAATARQYALKLNDQQSLPIAERALATADKALQRIRAALQTNASRLASVERLRTTGTEGVRAVASTLRGTVEINTASGWKMLSPDSLLGPGEEIRTGADGYAEVLFNDGSRVNLHANSSFQLASDNGLESDYELSLGRIKAQFERLGQRRYAVRTPTAVAGVRGTELLLETSADGASALVVLHGEVAFGPAKKGARISVRQGERAILAADGTLRGPEVVDPKTLSPWWE